MHAPAAGQDTAAMDCMPGADASRVQDRPFHDSASGAVAVAVVYWPTARHLVALAQDTALKPPDSAAPGGARVASRVHAVPFHRSARAPSAAKLVCPSPTATQAAALTHDTPVSV